MKAFFVNRRLAFGSAIKTWRHVERLRALGITHVINLRHSTHGRKVRQFRSLWLPFQDNKKPRPAWFYRRALRFYECAARQPNSKIFVMCHHGICRSATMTYFLLRSSGVGPNKAEAIVRRARPCVQIVRAYRESGEKYLRRLRRWQNIEAGRPHTLLPKQSDRHPRGRWGRQSL